MTDLIKFLLVAVVCSAVTTLGIWSVVPHNGVVIYRCDFSDISSNVPVEIKNECRKRILQGRI